MAPPSSLCAKRPWRAQAVTDAAALPKPGLAPSRPTIVLFVEIFEAGALICLDRPLRKGLMRRCQNDVGIAKYQGSPLLAVQCDYCGPASAGNHSKTKETFLAANWNRLECSANLEHWGTFSRR